MMNYKKVKGAYVHIPFCKSKCAYCDFTSYPKVTKEARARFIDRLREEIKIRGKGERLETLYFGGGTPSILELGEIERIIEALNSTFDLGGLEEFTIEVNPESLTTEKLNFYKSLGINRISIGVQSLDERLLNLIRRAHTREEAIRALDNIFESGFKNVSADIIYGLPTQSIGELESTLKTLLKFPLTHLSTYSLILEEDTPLKKEIELGKLRILPEKLEYEMGEVTDRILKENGFTRYEISNYEKGGYPSKHNSLYWNMDSYYGFGAGASSFVNGIRIENERRLENYERSFFREIIPPDEAILKGEMLFTGLRQLEGVSDTDYKNYFGTSLFSDFKSEIKSLTERGLIETRENRLSLTARGLELANLVFIEFL